jgi:ATP-binding cassette, subfamily B, multidrug efflux pump
VSEKFDEEKVKVDSTTAIRQFWRLLSLLNTKESFEAEQAQASVPGFRLLSYLSLSWLLVACVLSALIVSSIEVVLPQVMGFAVDALMNPTSGTLASIRGSWLQSGLYALSTGADLHQLSGPERLGALQRLGLAYCGLLAGASALSYAITLGLGHIGQRVVQLIRSQVFAKLHRLPIRYFDINPVGRVVTRVANDTGTVSELFTGVIANLLNSLLKLVSVWIALWWVSPKLTALLLLILPPAALATVWFQRESKEVQRQSRILMAKLNAFLQESLQGLPVIKAFTAEGTMDRRFGERNDEYTECENQMIFLYCAFRPVFATCSILALAILTTVGGLAILEKQLSLGSLVSYIFYLKMLFAPLDNLAEKFNVFQGAAVAAERIFEIIDAPEEPSGQTRGAADPEANVVEFRRVNFSYTADKPVLKEISFAIKPGQKVALVGATGSGKTTIVQLLLGYYPLEQVGNWAAAPENGGLGEILLWGKPLPEYDKRWLRSQFGFVQQDLFLFHADLTRNVNLFREIEPEQLSQALRTSRADLVLQRLENTKEDSPAVPGEASSGERALGERGLQLSQGERQLLSFARALVGEPPVVILDEATANIDSVTEATIQLALESVLEGRTALIIAHRLSTIERCDLILVMDQGRIVERGNHQQLMEQGGLYAGLVATQGKDLS